jgi:hypothetical protein
MRAAIGGKFEGRRNGKFRQQSADFPCKSRSAPFGLT